MIPFASWTTWKDSGGGVSATASVFYRSSGTGDTAVPRQAGDQAPAH